MAHDGQGSSIPGIGTHQYNSGATVALSATPESGWRFVCHG
ncbi:MAG: InlB B-repeat-containing protein [Dethiobacteraceae bacterium]